MLHSKTVLFLHPVYISLHLPISNSQFFLPTSLATTSLFYLWACFCSIGRFICVLFKIPHISDISHNIYLWLISLNMIISRTIHATANGIISLFDDWVTVHCILKKNHIFFIHSSVDKHLGCFHVLATINSATVNTGVHASFLIMLCLGTCPGMGLLYHKATLLLVSWETSTVFCIMAALIYLPTNSFRRVLFSPHSLTSILCRVFNDSHSVQVSAINLHSDNESGNSIIYRDINVSLVVVP